jgi:hypothetical protein
VIVAACDPGSAAGAVVRIDTVRRVVTMAAEWQTMKAAPTKGRHGPSMRWRTWIEGGETMERFFPLDRPASFNEAVGMWPTPDRAAVEAIAWYGAGGPDTLVLAESAGRAVEWFRALGVEPSRPKASEWRRAVLGLSPRTKASDAERAAVLACERGHLPRLPEGIGSGHAAEACAIAWWAAAQR